MNALERQIAGLAAQLEQLKNSIPVDEAATGITLEQHRPGNGSTYPRLRAAKGTKLANGKRTMGLSAEDAADWAQKIEARNQRAKVAQCFDLIQQAEAIATSITWEVSQNTGEERPSVNISQRSTNEQPEPVAAEQNANTVRYVLKDATGATTINRKVHAITTEEPERGRWHAPALCGEQPKAGSWGWRRVDKSELSCPKCYDKVALLK